MKVAVQAVLRLGLDFRNTLALLTLQYLGIGIDYMIEKGAYYEWYHWRIRQPQRIP